ncbi:hypothetical protein [Nocardioides sp. PD653]|uniref:hypothetical protein n=1 Tax=Nocardioides sp. PD653 TaxID=393303 RepID=UPI0013FD29DF|nr:hypothetical protein [Nocardioides sp. PD653]
MGADDDVDCVGHLFDLREVVVTGRGADQVRVCVRCGAPAYEPGQAALKDRRPPL